jgi:excisionase family DNA binding protein
MRTDGDPSAALDSLRVKRFGGEVIQARRKIMLALMERAPFIASDDEAVIAREAVSRLTPVAEANQDVRLRVMESIDVVVPIPARALRLIVDVLSYMADQKAVSFIPHDAELTTQQAADLLNVSRPYLVSMLERGDLPYRHVGAHRRIRAAHVLDHRTKCESKHKKSLDRIAEISQELNLD